MPFFAPSFPMVGCIVASQDAPLSSDGNVNSVQSITKILTCFGDLNLPSEERTTMTKRYNEYNPTPLSVEEVSILSEQVYDGLMELIGSLQAVSYTHLTLPTIYSV